MIVGGGPVGLTAAVLLGRLGIDSILLERRDFNVRHPRAHLLNVRTMEVFGDVGVADDIYRLGPPDDSWRKVTWYTSIAGPNSVHGRKIGEVQAWGGGTDADRYALASPRRFTNLPQTRLDPLLWAHADAALPGRIRAFQEVVAFDAGDGWVDVGVIDHDTAESYTLRADYVIAADGGRASTQLLDVEVDGVSQIRDVVNLYVTSDLSVWKETDALLAHFISPLGRGHTAGVLQALGPAAYGNASEEWLVAVAPAARSAAREGAGPSAPDSGGTVDQTGGAAGSLAPEPTVADARRLLGVAADHPIELHARSHWQYEGVVARRFRYGRVFIAGDAAHRHPPTGGLGLNCGVQDAHNLAWKLAAVIKQQAGDGLLDTYEAERRPIAAAYTAHSLENAGRHRPIAQALGLLPGQSEAEGWKQIAIWASDTEEGERRREAVDAAVMANAADYSQLNVEAGFFYATGALISDGSPPPANHESPIDFRPTNRPGHHVAHVWLDQGGRRISTVDLVQPEAFTLFTDPVGAERWSAAAESISRASSPVPIRVVVVGSSELTDDPTNTWASLRGVPDGGGVLVRPDRFVAWRGEASVDQAGSVLAAIVDEITAGVSADASDTIVAPLLERMRAAAERLRR